MDKTSTENEALGVKLPKLALVAAVLAFILVLSALVWIRSFRTDPIGVAASLLRDSSVPAAQVPATVILVLILCVVFFLAGRSLTVAGATRGSPLPWIACQRTRKGNRLLMIYQSFSC